MTPLIQIENLCKTYESGFTALETINLDIVEGEIIALLGPNGAGKTTLISIICGIVNPGTGSVKVGGHDIVVDYRATRSLIGLVPQELTTEAFESVFDAVSFSRGLFHRENPQGSFALGQEGQPYYGTVRWHETPGNDGKGVVP
jgi:ABC-2 type transport system ATP-binding protein